MAMSGRPRSQRLGRRSGAILSFELVFVVPIALIFFMALVEFSLLWSASHKVHLAAQNACRVATRPCSDVMVLDKAVRDTAYNSLIDKRLCTNHRLTHRPGAHTGDPVTVEIRVPMTAAAPDMLAMFGFSLQKRFLISRVVMSKE